MDVEYILEHNGYRKLAEQLPEKDKAFLQGYAEAIEELKDFKSDFVYDCGEDGTLGKIKAEIGEEVLDDAITQLDISRKEIMIGFVESN